MEDGSRERLGYFPLLLLAMMLWPWGWLPPSTAAALWGSASPMAPLGP